MIDLNNLYVGFQLVQYFSRFCNYFFWYSYSLAPLARPNTINEVNKILREGYRVKHLLENDGFLYVVYHLHPSAAFT